MVTLKNSLHVLRPAPTPNGHIWHHKYTGIIFTRKLFFLRPAANNIHRLFFANQTRTPAPPLAPALFANTPANVRALCARKRSDPLVRILRKQAPFERGASGRRQSIYTLRFLAFQMTPAVGNSKRVCTWLFFYKSTGIILMRKCFFNSRRTFQHGGQANFLNGVFYSINLFSRCSTECGVDVSSKHSLISLSDFPAFLAK